MRHLHPPVIAPATQWEAKPGTRGCAAARREDYGRSQRGILSHSALPANLLLCQHNSKSSTD